jgi:hypothetical protein
MKFLFKNLFNLIENTNKKTYIIIYNKNKINNEVLNYKRNIKLNELLIILIINIKKEIGFILSSLKITI